MTPLSRSQLVKAVDGAMRVRKRAGYQITQPVCVFDLAEKIDVEVKFIGGNSFGGMFVRDFERILVPAKRPPGRQAFTCAHELGHWYFDHGTRVELIEALDKGGDEDPDERIANVFASYLLMPKWAIEHALRYRRLAVDSASSVELYGVANQFGVGYETLLKHLHYGLHLLTDDRLDALLKISPKQIREQIIGTSTPRHLILTDKFWSDVAIDLAVGDAVRLPSDATWDHPPLRRMGACEGGIWAEAVRPGIMQVSSPSLSWASFVRVARAEYTGRSKFRFLEDPDVD